MLLIIPSGLFVNTTKNSSMLEDTREASHKFKKGLPELPRAILKVELMIAKEL